MRILIHAPDAEHWRECLIQELGQAWPEVDIETTERVGEGAADYLVVWKAPSSLFACQDQRLKAIFNAGAGVDAILNDPARPRNVPIIRIRDAGMGEMMSDYVLYGVMHFHRSMDRYRQQQINGQWIAHTLEDKAHWPVGIIGLGTLGQACAQRIGAQGYPVHGWRRSPQQIPDIQTWHGAQGLEAMLETSRVIINLLPDTAETRGLLSEERLARLPAGAVVINAGRGSTLDLDALMHLLDQGHLRGALLDVFPEEPLPAHHPLWRYPQVIITPHVAAPTPIHESARQVARSLLALARGDTVECVDPDTGY